ncbi:MAG: hypothetical protein M3081_11755 [Gemmatimonadota bacterium]|nr:hypothetical protein [Gemmatimonadota bacterium]
MSRPCIAGVAYAFPAAQRSVRELAAAGQLTSDPALLERFGFDRVHVAIEETPFELGLRAASELLDRGDVPRDRVGMLIYGGAPGTAAFVRGADVFDSNLSYRSIDRFTFPASRLQCQLDLGAASVVALDQLGCTTLFAAVRLARAMCVAEGMDAVLCVCADFAPCLDGREEIFNCTSDAACAVLVRADGERCRIAGSAEVTKGYYWDAGRKRDEIIASYFPTARHVIERAIADAGWTAADIDWVIPHNVSCASWDILRRLVGLDSARSWSRNLARDGHAIAGDTFINLADALASGEVAHGDKLLLFSYGYGAHWTALAVEA